MFLLKRLPGRVKIVSDGFTRLFSVGKQLKIMKFRLLRKKANAYLKKCEVERKKEPTKQSINACRNAEHLVERLNYAIKIRRLFTRRTPKFAKEFQNPALTRIGAISSGIKYISKEIVYLERLLRLFTKQHENRHNNHNG